MRMKDSIAPRETASLERCDGSFYGIEMTSKGGRAATLWIRKTTLLPERVTISVRGATG